MPVIVRERGAIASQFEAEVSPDAVAELNDQLSRPILTKEELERETQFRSRQKHVKLTDRTIGTTETKIGHGLNLIPFWYDIHAKDVLTDWRETRRPDEQFLYLIATAAVVVDILVEA